MKIDRFGSLDDSRDDSSVDSEHSSASPRRNNSTSFVKLPSMYSPASKASSHDRESDDEVSSKASSIDYDQLEVSSEVRELFKLIDAYEPVELELETPLKCFIPKNYTPSVGVVDPFIKIPRPDGKPDGVGTVILDEAIPSQQSNAAVIELQLKHQSKKKSSVFSVHSIDNAADGAKEIDEWIQCVEEIHTTKPPSEVRYHNKMPSTEKLMQAWPKELEEGLRNKTIELPKAEIDLSVEEYAKMMCTLLGIPVHDGHLLESLNVMIAAFTSACD